MKTIGLGVTRKLAFCPKISSASAIARDQGYQLANTVASLFTVGMQWILRAQLRRNGAYCVPYRALRLGRSAESESLRPPGQHD
jgi:hypothetical protein